MKCKYYFFPFPRSWLCLDFNARASDCNNYDKINVINTHQMHLLLCNIHSTWQNCHSRNHPEVHAWVTLGHHAKFISQDHPQYFPIWNMDYKLKTMIRNLQFVVVAAWNHFHTPAVTPVFAGDHSLPSTAYSLQSISCSQSGVLRTLFSASLYTCTFKQHPTSLSVPGNPFIPRRN